VLAVLLTVVVLTGYAGALWWLLRDESPAVQLAVFGLVLASLALRLVYTDDYPAGLNEDEIKLLACSMQALRRNTLFIESCIDAPVLPSALFWAQLVPWLGPTRWAIRMYSLVGSILSPAVAFALARGMGLAIAPSLATGAMIAVLPWSLFFGRISVAALSFNQLLVLAALARLIWVGGGWQEAAIGSLGLSLLLYDYFGGRVMLGMPLLAALLARGRSRAWCVAIVVVAGLAWIPYQRKAPLHGMVGFSSFGLDERLARDLAGTVEQKTVAALRSLVAPTGMDQWRTIRAAAMHPPLILALGLAGVLLSVGRRGLFLAGGFIAGMAPAVLSWGVQASAKRMLMAFPFIVLAAGCALEALDRRLPRRVATAAIGAIVVAIGVSSTRLFFSPEFWPAESRATFDWERSALIEALPPPPHPHLIVDPNLEHFVRPRAMVDNDFEYLAADNWIPRSNGAVIYAFDWRATLLRPFYQNLVGVNRVQTFGRAFLVRLEDGDWSWMHAHGWSYEARCGARTWRGQVPVLFHAYWSFADLRCAEAVTHIWRARWSGPAAHLRLRFTGTATVDTGRGRVGSKAGREQSIDFDVDPDSPVTVTLIMERGISTALLEVTPGGMRVPAFDRLVPMASDS